MIINYDRSRVTVSDKELMRHGYAEEDYHSIRLSFEYTSSKSRKTVCGQNLAIMRSGVRFVRTAH